jgi:16S rRNA processing protein RimM
VTRKLIDGRPHGNGIVALLEGVEDRNAAAALTGATVEVDRSELPPTGDREYYRADLVGLKVETLEGSELGTIAHFVDAPTGPLMVVREAGGREHWVLATPQYLKKVDLAAGRVLVDWPVELE